MAERHIAMGDTSAYRYIGIEPQVDDEAQLESLLGEIILPDWVMFRTISCTQESTAGGPAYTELGFDVDMPQDFVGRETVDAGALNVARQIAKLLEKDGDTVTILEGVFPTDFQTPLFGKRYLEMRAVRERYKSRREAK